MRLRKEGSVEASPGQITPRLSQTVPFPWSMGHPRGTDFSHFGKSEWDSLVDRAANANKYNHIEIVQISGINHAC